MNSIIFNHLWLRRRTHAVFFLLLFAFETLASFGDLQHGSGDNIDEKLSNNGHVYKAVSLQKCKVKYYQRNVCKVTEFRNKFAARQPKTKEGATRYNSETFSDSKTKTEHFESTEKARENSKAKNKDWDKLSKTLNYHENLQEFDKLRRIDLENRFKFPSEKVCPYLSIRAKSKDKTSENVTTCRTSRLNESDCEFINTYLGKPSEIPPRFCPQRKTMRNICWFGKRYRSSIQDKAELQCDTGICMDNAVYLGVFNTTVGQVKPDDDWLRLANESALVEAIGDIMKKNYSNHFRFCFLRCILKDHPSSRTKQLLIFPPIVHRCPNKSPPRFNINIIVQDSISRHQFYRALQKTVNTLREITHDPSIDATVLDFEKYQSYDSSTHSNMKKLFAGENVNRNKTDVSRTIMELYKKFKKASYKTAFQEDACWFEGFGSLLRPTFLSAKNGTYSLWTGFYEYIKENLMPNVNSFGIGFSSCKLLQDLGDTNIFNGETLPALCLDGRPLSHYYLNVVQNLLEAYKNNSCPVFSYLHLNTGHEHTGQRITQDDEYLAGFVKTMATQHKTTLTILLSDHGSKTTEYATRTVQGLKEIYKPFMFMIVPRQVAKVLGNERMGNLIRNQKRLVALEDLYLALDDVVRGFGEDKAENIAGNIGNGPQEVNEDKMDFGNVAGSKDGNGLFGNIVANRNCSELKLSADAVCLCEGEDVDAVMDSFFLDFLASIAVGGLNNMIQSQYNSGSRALNSDVINNEMALSKHIDRETKSENGILEYVEDTSVIPNKYEGLGGYGNCLRYILKRVERLRRKVIGEDRITTFSVVVNTVPVIYNREEVFEMTVGHHLTNTNGIRLLKVTRLSRYSVFKSCADAKVQLDLCTCDKNSQTDPKNYLWEVLGFYMFTQPSNIDKLEFSCLYLITTKRQRFLKSGKGRDAVLAYEIINACDRIFNVTLLDTSLVRKPFILSRPLPFSIMVYPNAVHHVISAFCGLPDGEFVANFKVDVAHA